MLTYLKKLKDERDLTYNDIAEISKIPLATVTRVFNGGTADPRLDTIVPIVIALGGSLDELFGIAPRSDRPLSTAVEQTLTNYADLIKQKDEIISEKNERITSLEARLTDKRELISTLKDDLNRERKAKRHAIIIAALFISIVLIVLVVDVLHGSFGFITY